MHKFIFQNFYASGFRDTEFTFCTNLTVSTEMLNTSCCGRGQTWHQIETAIEPLEAKKYGLCMKLACCFRCPSAARDDFILLRGCNTIVWRLLARAKGEQALRVWAKCKLPYLVLFNRTRHVSELTIGFTWLCPNWKATVAKTVGYHGNITFVVCMVQP